MGFKKFKLGCIVGLILLVTTVPVFISVFSVTTKPVDDVSSINGDVESLAESNDLTNFVGFHIMKFEVTRGLGNIIKMRVRMGGSTGLGFVRVSILLLNNRNQSKIFTGITNKDGWITKYYLNLRLFTKGTYYCVVESALYLFGVHSYNPSDNMVSHIQSLTL